MRLPAVTSFIPTLLPVTMLFRTCTFAGDRPASDTETPAPWFPLIVQFTIVVSMQFTALRLTEMTPAAPEGHPEITTLLIIAPAAPDTPMACLRFRNVESRI